MTPHRLARTALCLAALTLSACGAPETADTSCTGLTPVPAAAATARLAPPEAVVSSVVADLFAPAARGRTAPLDVLVLSTGGQGAAFGAGILAGWTANRTLPRPVFDVVTGASAGATVAPAAFAGPEFDALLPFATQTDIPGLATPRPLISLAFSNSVFDVRGLEATVARNNTPALRAALAAGPPRKLLIGAVNLETTGFQVFDLASFAARPDTNPDCIGEAVLASAAIPALFPPRRINGTLYADAGLREHVFLRGIEGARRQAGSDRAVNVWLILNGDLAPLDPQVGESLPALGLRAFDIVTDEGTRQSLLNVLDLAATRGWTFRAATADGVDLSACEGPGAAKPVFEACVVNRLFAAGRTFGASAGASDWLTETDLRRLIDRL